MTERAITAVQAMKTNMENPDAFLSVAYAKAVVCMDKMQARNTDALQRTYREACQVGDGAQGLDILKRTVEACSIATAIVNTVAALHDHEATAETLDKVLGEARLAGVNIPPCADQISRARHLKELAKGEEWSDYMSALDINEGLANVFDINNPAAILDFQASSVMSTLKAIMMKEIKVKIPDEEEFSEAEALQRQKAEGARLTTSLQSFLHKFMESPVCKFWEGNSTTPPCFNDIKRLRTMVDFQLQSDDKELDASDVEVAKSCRTALLQAKKGVFYEAMTLFPLGIHIQDAVSSRVNTFHMDKSLVAQLQECVDAIDGFKAFTTDALLKEKAGGNGEPDQIEIVFPNSSKLVDFTSKYNLVETMSSAKFKETFQAERAKVETKIRELLMALRGAAASKFQKKHGAKLAESMSKLFEKEVPHEAFTTLVAQLAEATSFSPFSKTTGLKVACHLKLVLLRR